MYSLVLQLVNNRLSHDTKRVMSLHTASQTQRLLASYPHRLKRWRHSNIEQNLDQHEHDFLKKSDPDSTLCGEDINDSFEEIDSKMSANSFEIPEHQAKHVREWLNDYKQSPHEFHDFEIDFEEKISEKGNVIGIRGFPTATISSECGHRGKYLRLKSEHSKLQSDYQKLLLRLDNLENRTHHAEQKRDDHRHIIFEKSKHSRCKDKTCPSECHLCELGRSLSADLVGSNHTLIVRDSHFSDEQKQELDHLRHELRRLESNLQQKDQIQEKALASAREENERLKRQYNDRCMELDNMKNEIKNLSYAPANRVLLALKNENLRLKDVNHADIVNYEKLLIDYAQMENKIKMMTDDQKCLDEQRDEELNKLMTELCRLQVYQPKLETLLETERQIKAELEDKIDLLKKENDKLRETIVTLEQNLSKERLRIKANDSSERRTLEAEIVRWQEKYEQLRGEINQVNEMLRSTKGKLAMFERKHMTEVETLVERNKCEIDRSRADLLKVQSDNTSMRNRLATLQEKLDTCENEKRTLSDCLLDTKKKLELEMANRKVDTDTMERYKKTESEIVELRAQLMNVESEKRRLASDLDQERKQSEQAEQKVAHYKHCYTLQQRALDELRESKDKELSRLRVSLNLEQYNRQVALRGVERELRASLKELETVKCRFSNRLVGQSGDNLATSSAATTSTPRQSKMDCTIEAQED